MLPYYLMRYEDACRETGKLEWQYLFRTRAGLIIETAIYLAPDNEKGKVEAMGGTVIKPILLQVVGAATIIILFYDN